MGALIDMDAQTHWEKIYTEKAPNTVSGIAHILRCLST